MLNFPSLSVSNHTFSYNPIIYNHTPPLKFQSFALYGYGGTKFPSGSCSYGLRRKRVLVKGMLKVEEEVVESGKRVDFGEGFDAIVIGSGIGGLVAGTQLAVKGAKVLVLEKYVIPGGSSGFYNRDGYTFDVGSSVMFGFSDKVCSFYSKELMACP
jgi:prolycopene isomerase